MLKLILAALIVCTYSQVYLHLGPGSGVCRASSNASSSPPNYSKNNVVGQSCRSQCSADELCVGYSTAESLAGGSVNNRCAIWVDRVSITTAPSGWGKHNYPTGWVENTSELNTGSGDAEWDCYVRIDNCPAGFIMAGGVTLQYGEINQGMYVDLLCSDFDASTTGEVRVECQNGKAIKTGNGTCVPLAIPEWTELDGQGVCRDTSNVGTITKSVGPGVSPPNFSIEGKTLQECKDACTGVSGIPLICTGISYGGLSKKRCALFINTSTQYCGNKQGYETHDYEYGWKVGSSEVDGVSGEAGWKCYVRNVVPAPVIVDRTITYQLMPGTGVCANAADKSPANFSRNGETQAECMSECTGYQNTMGLECLGFAHNLQVSRCALYMNQISNTAGLADWESHQGEVGWSLDPVIAKADQVGGGWLCFKKVSARKKN